MKEIINQLNLLQDIVEGVPTRIFWKDRECRYLGCNTLFAWDAGLSHPDELIGKTDFEMVWKDQAESYQTDDLSIMETATSRLGYEEVQSTPDGQTVWLRTSKVPLRDNAQNVIGILGVYEDITHEKQQQVALQNSEKTLKNIFNSLQDAYYRTDIEGRIVMVSPSAGILMACEPDELLGKPIAQYYLHESRREQFLCELSEGDGSVSNFEAQIRRVDGQIIWVSTNAHYFRDAQGNVTGVEGTIRDVTQLKQQEEQLLLTQFVSNSAPDSILWIDEQARIQYVNESACCDHGYSKMELLNMSIYDLNPNLQPEEWPTHWQKLQQQGTLMFEAMHCRKDGSCFPIEVSANFVKFGDKEYNISFSRNITERKKAEEELQLAKFVMDNAPLNITYLDSEARIRYINKTGCETLGYTQEEILQLSIPDIDPLFPMEVWDEHWEDLKHNKSVPVETQHRRKNGERFPIEVIANYIEFGDKAYNVAFDRDISERQKAEAALRRFRIALDNSADSIFLIDRNTMMFIDVNEGACKRLGYSREELLTMGPSNIKPYFTREHLEEAFDRVISENDEFGVIETIHACKDGSEFAVEIRLKPFMENNTQLLVAVGRDISERQKAEERLLQEANFRSQLLDQAAEGVVLWRLSNSETFIDFLIWNRRMQDITGYSREEINRMGWLQTMYADESERIKAHSTMQKVLDGEINQGLDFGIVTKSGERRMLHIASAPVLEEDKEPSVLAVIQDITESKRQQDLLETSQKRFRELFDSSSDGLFIINMQGEFIDINKTAYERLGYAKDEMLAMKLTELDPPEFAAKVPERLGLINKHGKATFETAHYRKDGSIMPVEINARIIELDGEKVFFSVVRDISERKQFEERLRQAQKMEAVGTLVGGIAHDFNNMLAAIQGNVFLAKMQLMDHPNAKEKLANIEKLGTRAAEMVQQLLTFARKGMVSMRTFSLNSFMDEGYKLAKTLIPENIDHQPRICEEILHIKGDATQLQQVLMNLLSNAVDAVAGIPHPTIRCSLTPFEADQLFIENHPELKDRSFACISIKDNGYGMPSDVVDKIFEPFFTTKEVGKGTGLGLAMLYGAMQTHNGAIEVESEVNKGTDFRIYLPISNVERETKPDEQYPSNEIGRGRRILLVDDEESVRSTISEVLSSMGYHVIEAGNGKEALDLFKAQQNLDLFKVPQNRIDLIISDVIMPVMGGPDLLGAARLLDDKVPVILVTGYDKDHVIDQEIKYERCQVLNKPVDFDQLSQSIQEMIGR
ncbi:PAS domain S-box-containing protein [Mariprofundus aestuarium]|uniref:histidine kinase n=1 Tax=Mariprofundus aestuarium TaxID=1921086 RepID=A0A2K8L5H2_MARES|nr:PAS domain S-box protein [Mariprofundus aestuarium]ATX79476.1 PAS domain S-box-containing protein [Mariprofundus aestuarium]